MKFLIAGLGNIGAEYENTRHNIGFMVLDEVARMLGADFSLDKQAMVASVRYKGKVLTLIKPTTYMNLSGKAVNYWLQTTKTTIDGLLVVTDDIALPYGKMRIKTKGSSGGHNGLAHIEQTLMSAQYARLRFGVGNNFGRGQQANYVLSPFNKAEQADLQQHIQTMADAVLSFCSVGAARTMNIYN